MTLNTADDNVITVPHNRMWTDNISNSNDGAKTLQCVADFCLTVDHDAIRSVLQDVALTSAYRDYARPVVVVLKGVPWGTHYKICAYPFDMRDQFVFVSDMTVRGKAAIAALGARMANVPAATTETGLIAAAG